MSLLRRWLQSARARMHAPRPAIHQPRRRPRRPCLLLEPLEDRLTPATVDWMNAAGGDWDTGSNWSTDTVPSAGDDVVISQTGITITHSASNSDAADSVQCAATLSMSAGTLAFGGSSSLNALSLSGGTVTGTGAITVTGPFSWTGGTLSGGSSLTAQGNTTISDGTLDTRNFINNGTAVLNSYPYYLLLEDGAQVINSVGATLDLQSIYNGGTSIRSGTNAQTCAVYNDGTLSSEAVDENAIGPAVYNSGTVTVNSGFLNLVNTAANDGLMQVIQGTLITGGVATTYNGRFLGKPGTTLDFTGSTKTFAAASSVSGDQVILDLSGGSMVVNGAYSAGSTAVTAATGSGNTVTFNAPASIGALQASAMTTNILGGITGAGITTLSIQTYATVNLTAPSAAPLTLAPANVVIDGTLNLTDCAFENSAGQTFTLVNAVNLFNGSTFENDGTVNITADNTSITGDATSVFDNNAGGTVQKAGGAGFPVAYTNFGIKLNNSGTVAVEHGGLILGYVGANAPTSPLATFNAGSSLLGGNALPIGDSNTAVVLRGGASFATGSTVSGFNEVSFNAPATIAGSYSANTTLANDAFLDITGATLVPAGKLTNLYVGDGGGLRFGGSLTTTGLFTWEQGGTVTGVGGTAIVTAAGGMQFVPNISGAAGPSTLDHCTLVNPGTATGHSVTLDVTCGAILDNLPGATFLDANEGVNGINLSNGGTVTGAGIINAAIDNVGLTAPGTTNFTAALTINQGYLQEAGGTLAMGIGGYVAGNEYDQLVIDPADRAYLEGGPLNVSMLNGFIPQPASQFTIIDNNGNPSSTFTSVGGFAGLPEGARVSAPGTLANGSRYTEYFGIDYNSNVNLTAMGTLAITADQSSVVTSGFDTATNTGTYTSPAGGVTLTASLGTVVNNGDGTWSWSYAGNNVATQTQVTITATDPDGNVATTAFAFTLQHVEPTSLSGIVFVDFNNDGQVDFGENGITGVTITLAGTDDLGQSVNRCQQTDADGCYVFLNLRPGSYTITETQPAGYPQGIDSVGTAGGSLVGTDQFAIQLGQGIDGMNYNFGEQPPATGGVQKGQTATIGFWDNKNGQALIRAFNGGTGTQLADWLAATMPNTFGTHAGSNDVAGCSNAAIGALFQQDFLLKGVKLDAQVLATALSVYATNATLDSTAIAAQYGFTVSGTGLGTDTVNVGSNGDAFGVANNTTMTVMDLLLATDAQAVDGVLYGGNATKRTEANSVYTAINQAGEVN